MITCLELLSLAEVGAEVFRGLDNGVDGYAIVLQVE
jgi:hypothetical protein